LGPGITLIAFGNPLDVGHAHAASAVAKSTGKYVTGAILDSIGSEAYLLEVASDDINSGKPRLVVTPADNDSGHA